MSRDELRKEDAVPERPDESCESVDERIRRGARLRVAWQETDRETAYGATTRLSFSIRVF